MADTPIPIPPIPTDTAVKAAQATTKLDLHDVTDNDPPGTNIVARIIMRHGYPVDKNGLDSLELASNDARREKRLAVIKAVLFAIIGTVPTVLLFLTGMGG